MFGYAFSKALISTTRGSGLVVVIGLAHQVMFPLVADPLAAGALAPDAAGELGDPLLHALMASTAAALAAAASARRRRPRFGATRDMASSPFCSQHLVRERPCGA